jgi:hypothetical protein
MLLSAKAICGFLDWRTPILLSKIAQEVLKSSSAKPASDKLFAQGYKESALSTKFSEVKRECLKHCLDHVAVLEQAKEGALSEQDLLSDQRE